MKNTVTLEIAGTKYRFVADADEARLQELATLINERVEGKQGQRSVSSSHLLAMAALSLADDLKAAQSRVQEVEGRLAAIERRLDESQQRLQEVDGMTRTTLSKAIARIDRRLAQDSTSG